MLRLFLCLVFLVVGAKITFAASTSYHSVYSQSNKKKMQVGVILPSSYTHSIRRYPVVYLLHWHGGTHNSWPSCASIEESVDALDVIIVCPNASREGWYFDATEKKDQNMATFVGVELINWVDAHFRTRAVKQARAITGFSMGGHGALYLAAKYPQRFVAAGSISGVVDLTFAVNSWGIKKQIGEFVENKQNWYNRSVIDLLDVYKKQYEESIIIHCGTGDFLLASNRNLHRMMNECNISHEYLEKYGKHTKSFACATLGEQLSFFTQIFSRHSLLFY